MTETQAPTTNKKFTIKFNRDKRLLRSALISGAALCLTGNPLYFLVAHILATLFWDWFLFDYRQVKESHQVTPEILMQACNVTPAQLDHYAGFVVNTRRIAFCISSVVGIIAMLLVKDKFLAEITFPLTYACLVMGIVFIGINTKNIKYPYPASKRSGIDSDPFGLYNPISPNYVFRDHSSPYHPYMSRSAWENARGINDVNHSTSSFQPF